MSYLAGAELDMDRSKDRNRRDYDRDRRSHRDRDRDRDREKEGRGRDRDRDRDRDRSRDDRRDRDREYRGRSSEDRERHSRHNRDQQEHMDEPDDSHGSDDWPSRRRSGPDPRGRWNDSIPNNIILMRGLPAEAVESDVVSELLKTGTVVKDVRLMRSKESGCSLRYCFVEFHGVAEAQYWMEQNEGELMFGGKYPVNMFYSTSRRGNLHTTVAPSLETSLLDGSADWTCIKCSCKNFQRRNFCRRCNHSRLETERVAGGDGLDQVGSNPCNTLILRGLDGLTMEENITTAFANLTSMPLKNVRVIRDRQTGASNGFAFVELNSLKESQDLLEYLENMSTPLEVDGKALLVAYAKNTFSTALSTLEQSYASALAVDYNQQQAGYYDYSNYYNYSAPAADSTNAAEVAQAAILAFQQKKQKQTNSTAAVVSAAPVLNKLNAASSMSAASASEYQQYPVPDVSTYQYDETSGYYYDPSTGLYYDANSQYYYNSQTQQYLYWDGEKQTYLPAPTSTADTAAGQDQKKEDEQKKRPASPDKKVKVAKKIVKDMEKWAKKLNAQKEQFKDMTKSMVVAQPPVAEPVLFSQPASAAADAGFSLLEKAVYGKKAVEVSKPVEVPSAAATQATQVLSQSLYSKAEMESQPSTSDASGGVMSVEELIDWSKLACLLCRRAFPSKDVLLKHQQMSELHKKNVEDLIQAKGGGLSQDGSTLQYRDRARERRAKYGVPEPPLPKRRRAAVESEPVAFEQPTAGGIKDDNIGNKLLQKMGWQEGQGLGQRGQGIVDPIEAKQRQAQAGLGARGSAYNVDPQVGSYKERARKTFYHYFQEIN